jgi:dTDP-4-dehydrorhamnose reductase
MQKIFVIGSYGQVGRSLEDKIKRNPQIHGTFMDRDQLDLVDPIATYETVKRVNPDFLINAAAYTQVDKAESDVQLARKINADACTHLASVCRELDIPLLHYSTDYVYHNGQDRPLLESDKLNPQSIYGITKLEGEAAVRKHLQKYFILRTSWVYDAYGQNFVKTMLKLAGQHPKLTVVYDQIGSPTYAPDLAQASLEIAYAYFKHRWQANEAMSPYGIYNFSNEGVCSWYDFALAIFKYAGIDIKISPVTSDAFPRPAPRPTYSVMNKARIRSFLEDYEIPHWQEALEQCLDIILKKD